MNNEERDELLIRIDERTDSILKRLDNHGERLVVLERFKGRVLGGLGVLSMLAGAAVKWALSKETGQ